MSSINKNKYIIFCNQDLAHFKEITSVCFSKKMHLWNQGDAAQNIFLITSGFVDVYKITPEGEEKIFGLFGPGNAIGLSAAMSKGNYPASCIAQTEVEAIKIPYQKVLNQMQSSEQEAFNECFKNLLMQHQDILLDKINTISSGSIEERMNTFFSTLVDRFGESYCDSYFLISLPLTKTQIAKYIDARVETVIRQFSRWKKEELIIFKDKGVLINKKFI